MILKSMYIKIKTCHHFVEITLRCHITKSQQHGEMSFTSYIVWFLCSLDLTSKHSGLGSPVQQSIWAKSNKALTIIDITFAQSIKDKGSAGFQVCNTDWSSMPQSGYLSVTHCIQSGCQGIIDYRLRKHWIKMSHKDTHGVLLYFSQGKTNHFIHKWQPDSSILDWSFRCMFRILYSSLK